MRKTPPVKSVLSDIDSNDGSADVWYIAEIEALLMLSKAVIGFAPIFGILVAIKRK